MKYTTRVWMVWLLCATFSGLPAWAEGAEGTDDTGAQPGMQVGGFEVSSDLHEAERKGIMEAVLQLTDAEAAVFWPTYSSYLFDSAKLNETAAELVAEYVESGGEVPEERALGMLNEYIRLEHARLRLRQQYVERLKRKLPPTKVLRFFQVENKLDAIQKYELSQRIPLAGGT